jgi:hypothetical protein
VKRKWRKVKIGLISREGEKRQEKNTKIRKEVLNTDFT